MIATTIDILEKLEEKDKDKVSYFMSLLLNQSNYKKLKKEIAERRIEIEEKDTLNHDDFWKNLNV